MSKLNFHYALLGRQGGHNWQKYFICLFHVSELVDHFKARLFLNFFIQENDPPGPQPASLIWKIPYFFHFSFLRLPLCTLTNKLLQRERQLLVKSSSKTLCMIQSMVQDGQSLAFLQPVHHYLCTLQFCWNSDKSDP